MNQFSLDDAPRQRPWSLLVVGDFQPSPEVLDEIETIFELYPAIPGIELRRDDGHGCSVTREFVTGHTDGIEDALRVMFAEQPELAEVRFFGNEAKTSHIATRAEPFWHRDGKAIADINAQMLAGDISPTDAIELLRSLFEGDRAASTALPEHSGVSP
jgi:hypothetical protein